ncbi:MAG: SDR family oxidoreductase [Burkholderiaceae bacterium]|nr:SDR family oxidoreductase [Burkholderiaceae bacterium]
MDLQLKDRHVLITGGSKGIGLACARQYLAEGARVCIVSRSQANIDQAIERLRGEGFTAQGYAADLIDAQAAQRMVEEVEAAQGPIDILVNSAGAARRTPFNELTPKIWGEAMQAKFFTYINVIDPLVKRMAQRGRGAIVNIVGMGGKIASPTHLAGGSANAALNLATAGLAAAYAAQGVRINSVNPGGTLTERMAEGFAAEARLRNISTEEVGRLAQARMPLGRFADPEEIANATLFLSSPRASYITGAILSMDGALTPLVV